MQGKTHWEQVYSTKATDAVSWYEPHATASLRMIQATGVSHDAAIIDVGGGASRLVDDLLDRDFRALTVLDLSGAALAAASARLGSRAGQVTWIEADITRVTLPTHAYDVWHDRAVFHFLTQPTGRRAYVDTLLRALRPGGHVVIATFAEDGPQQCSGLPVMRYSAAQLHAEFGDAFTLVSHHQETHQTPTGTAQRFTWCLLKNLKQDDEAR